VPLDPTIKNYPWLDLVLGLYEAYEQNAESVLLVDSAGNLCEGPGFNIFVLKGNTLSTPQSGVLQCCDVTPAMAMQADELFVTSTAGGPMPLTELNGQPVGEGAVADEPGPVTEKIIAAYWALHDDPAYAEVV
jgi:branched-chain amino acid aminotransferase